MFRCFISVLNWDKTTQQKRPVIILPVTLETSGDLPLVFPPVINCVSQLQLLKTRPNDSAGGHSAQLNCTWFTWRSSLAFTWTVRTVWINSSSFSPFRLLCPLNKIKWNTFKSSESVYPEMQLCRGSYSVLERLVRCHWAAEPQRLPGSSERAAEDGGHNTRPVILPLSNMFGNKVIKGRNTSTCENVRIRAGECNSWSQLNHINPPWVNDDCFIRHAPISTSHACCF